MRIAVNVRLLLKDRLEGIGWFTYQTLKRIVADHPDDRFLFLFDRPFDPSFIFGPNVEARAISPPARHPVLFRIWFEWRIPAVLRAWKADVFLSPDGLSSLRAPVPAVCVMHDLAFEHYPQHLKGIHRRYLRRWSPKFARAAAQVVTVSEFSAQDISTRYGIRRERISVACNGAHEAYHPLTYEAREAAKERWAGGPEYFVFAGALHPRKNVAALLQAFVKFKRWQRSDMKLVIVGRMAWKYTGLEHLAATMPFKEDVVWTGYRGAEELSDIIGGAYALVYPSLFEGFGIPILEALACGVPGVVSNTSSMPEVAGLTAILCDPTDPESISAGMQTIYKDEALRERLAAAAPAQVAKFTWARAAAVLWAAVEKAAGTKEKK